MQFEMTKGKDRLLVTILPDGNFKVETDAVSAANHGGAEMLLREMTKAAGGGVDQKRKLGYHSHGQGLFHKH